MPQPFWKNPYIVLVLCTLMILISYGTRQSFGLFLIPISDAISNGRVEPFSFAVSLQTLIVGLSVPFVSAIADKWLGPIKMLVMGGALYAAGMYLLGHSSTELHLALSVGVISGLAAAGCGLPMLLSVVSRVAPEEKRSLWMGIVSAGGTGATIGAHAIALIGLSNMIGTALAGKLGGHFQKKNLLVFLYVGRSVVMLAFFLAPISQMSVYIFASCIGLLWLATVPLTAGIVSTLFGPRYIATLYAIAFLSHQIGGSLSTWMGGIIRDATGSYDIWWWVIIMGGALAALLHLPIKERPVARLAQQA